MYTVSQRNSILFQISNSQIWEGCPEWGLRYYIIKMKAIDE